MPLRSAWFVAVLLTIVASMMLSPASAVGAAPSTSTLLIALDHPIGVAVDPSGNVYFTEYGGVGNGWLRKLSRNGTLTTLLGNLTTPTGVAVDSDGNIYFAETSPGTVKRLQPSTSRVETVAVGLSGAWGLAYDETGYLYVSERSINGTVKRVNLQTGSVDAVLLGLDLPYGIATDELGNLYIVEKGSQATGRILKYSEGNPSPRILIDDIREPYAVASLGADVLYVTDKLGRLLLFDETTRSLTVLIEGLGRVYGVATDTDANVFLAAFGSPAVSNTGSLQVYGNPPTQLTSPQQPLEIEEITAEVTQILQKVEEIRTLSLSSVPPVKVFYREFFHRYPLVTGDEGFWELAQQEYEALHLIPDGLDVKARMESFLAGAVLGFHDSESNEIFIVTSEKNLRINRGVLAHELTHALTSRHYADAYSSSSNLTDEILARLSVVEGDADFVESEYLTWCRTVAGEECPLTVDTGSAVGPDIPQGILLIELFPYTAGDRFVQGLYKERGWRAVNEAYENLPTSTEQIIHPEKYLADLPKRVLIEDLKPAGWEVVGVDILGEASMYVMLYNRGVVRSTLQQDFKSVYTEGWGGDKMLVLRKDSSYGYIWRTLWDTPADADEFVSGYELLLKSLGAERRGTYWKIDADDYVFIDRQLLYVTIVNGPSEAALSELYPPLATLPVRLERVELVDPHNSTVESIASGEPMSIRISAANEEDESVNFSSLIHIRNETGHSVFMSAVTSAVDPNHVLSYEVGWTPLATGKYTVEVVAWRAFSDPTPLSVPLLANVTVSD